MSFSRRFYVCKFLCTFATENGYLRHVPTHYWKNVSICRSSEIDMDHLIKLRVIALIIEYIKLLYLQLNWSHGRWWKITRNLFFPISLQIQYRQRSFDNKQGNDDGTIN